NNTGKTINIIDNEFPHPIYPDSALGMTAFKIFTIDIDPPTDPDRYLIMKGINYKTLVEDHYDETGDDTPGDKRFVMSSGPFNMAAGDSASTCVGVMCAWDRSTLFKVSDIAQEIYDNNFELATPPAAPEITVTPGDKFLRISWTRKSETTLDPYFAKIDSAKRWYTYFPGTYSHRKHMDTTSAGPVYYTVDTTLVDSLEIKTGATTRDSIKRGDPNPVGGSDTVSCKYNQQAMYNPYDFQGYIVYRAKTQADLVNPAKREMLGGKNTNAVTGASGYFFDKVDNIQIVLDLSPNTYAIPGAIYILPKFDTIGTDRGLIYAITDEDVVNNFGYYYGVSAYDYQPNVYFTRKCPTTLASNPASGSACKFAAAQAPTSDYKPATVSYATTGGADSRSLDGNGAMNYGYELFVRAPNITKDASYTIRWSVSKEGTGVGVTRTPVYSGMNYSGQGGFIDSLRLVPSYGQYAISDTGFYGSPNDQMPFGGIVFKPLMRWNPNKAKISTDSLAITEAAGGARTYPRDSCFVTLDPNTFKIDVATWMWRGSDFEIRWKDTVVNVSSVDTAALTCTVWDMTNNIEVPFQGGLGKADMTKPGWCFDYRPLASGTMPYIYNRSNNDNRGIFISGLTVYFKRPGGGGAVGLMSWTKRPETGDIWRINCTGPRPPVDGNVVTFTTTAAGQTGDLNSSLLDNVRVVPNPYLVRAKWDVTPDYPNLYFTNLPAKCTIRIYNMAGDLVRVLKHETTYTENNSSAKWNLLTTYNKRVASGLYIYHVDAPGLGTKIGKFAVIK
ncbi:MAG: hypothetical protein QME74_08000, partial [Candidatus Edwardsbacteria bacterium]|nr:hypothetical protein [Candidatus Edwardsbacteria bacterium]